MDQRAWLWKKKSSEKTIVANGKADLQLKGDEEEVTQATLPCKKTYSLHKTYDILKGF